MTISQKQINEPEVVSQMPQLSDSYVKLFSHKHVVSNYRKKFTSRIEQLRHLCEVQSLAPYVRGKLLDCSVGTGRLIPHLSQVTEFHANDTSVEFLEYVKTTYPFVHVKPGDLRTHIEYPSDSFDTVMSIRTLFAIGPITNALSEMSRVCKVGGHFIFDYQNVPNRKKLQDGMVKGRKSDPWSELGNFQESPDTILDQMSGVSYNKYPLDMFLHYIKSGAKAMSPEYINSTGWWGRFTLFKKHLWFRFFNSKLNIIPDRFWVYYEGLSNRYPVLSFKPQKTRYCRRYLYVCHKKSM